MTQGAGHSPGRDSFDLIVIGGGINSARVARDAAGRGASVLLLERGDLAQGGTISDLGEDIGRSLSAKEVDHLVDRELAMETGDILWRRSKLGLHFSALQTHRLEQYLQKKVIFP